MMMIYNWFDNFLLWVCVCVCASCKNGESLFFSILRKKYSFDPLRTEEEEEEKTRKIQLTYHYLYVTHTHRDKHLTNDIIDFFLFWIHNQPTQKSIKISYCFVLFIQLSSLKKTTTRKKSNESIKIGKKIQFRDYLMKIIW